LGRGTRAFGLVDRKDRERLGGSCEAEGARRQLGLRSPIEKSSRRGAGSRCIEKRHRNYARFLGLVEDDKDELFLGLTQENVSRIVGEEMNEFAARECGVFAAHAEQVLDG